MSLRPNEQDLAVQAMTPEQHHHILFYSPVLKKLVIPFDLLDAFGSFSSFPNPLELRGKV